MKSRSSLALAGALALGILVALAFWLTRPREQDPALAGAELVAGTALALETDLLSAPRSADPSALPVGVEREAPAAASRLRARIEHRVTHAALPGFDAELVADGIVLGHDTSDSRGRLFLPLPPESGATVRVEAPEGWSVLAPQRWIRADTTEELVFLAGPAGSERFRARLVDAESGEPLQDYMLRLGTRDGRREQLVSDRAGLVASAVDYPEGTLLLFCYDEYGPELGDDQRKPLHYLELEHTIEKALAGPHELRLEVGPTYRLELEGPPAALEAPLAADLRWYSNDRPPTPAIGSFVVRAGTPPWVRFPPRFRPFETYATIALAISSRDGRWYGSTRVPGTRGEHTVSVELTAQGIVVVRVLDPDGNGIPGALVELHPLVAGAPEAAVARQKTAGNGLVEFLFVPTGAYSVSAVAASFERRFQSLVVDGEQRSDATLALARQPGGLTISGRVIGLPGNSPSLTLTLFGVRRGTDFGLQRELVFDRQGDEAKAEFEFTDLAPGDYVLDCYAGFEWWLEPCPLQVSAGTRGIELRLEQGPEPPWFELVATDAGTGKPLDEVCAWFEHSADSIFQMSGPPLVLYPPSRVTSDSRLGVVAPGYRAAHGSLAELRDDGEHPKLELKLERGWSGEFIALGPGFAPIAGVRVVLDGETAGTTNVQGTLDLVRERAPARIELDYRGWLVEPVCRGELAELAAGRRSRVQVYFTPQ
ncbi:MAG: carboxypeptidase-like regulatory domain-containing protein [Planctomycetota bacterium]|nr:carboxypeptidase-like regulatory domain-containing protein [Planctomycetota bacterium]